MHKNLEENCLSCGKTFLTNHYERKRGWGRYCSISCSSSHAPKPKRSKNGWKANSRKKRKGIWKYKDRAREYVHRAIKRGVLIRPTKCDKCLKPCKPDAHHENYEYPGEVAWMCRKCHMLEHRRMNQRK